MGSKSGELNKKREWRLKNHFSQLPDDGFADFSEFLSQDDRRRLDFWRFAPSFDSEKLKSFISDGTEMLKDVTEEDEYKEKILKKADKVSSYIAELREKMEADLKGEFSRFKMKLDEEINKPTQKRK